MHWSSGSLGQLATQPERDLVQPDLGFLSPDEGLDYQEPQDTARQQLSEAVALAVVLRRALPAPEVHALRNYLASSNGSSNGSGHNRGGICALSLALPSDDGAADWLALLPVMAPAGRRAESAGVEEALVVPSGVLGPSSAAHASFSTGGTLIWRASSGSHPTHEDWSLLLAVQAGRQLAGAASGERPPRALVTVPLQSAGGGGHGRAPPLGSATFALAEEPGEGDVDALRALGASLARSIQHQTKSLWEESLGFLTRVVPPKVVQRMLSAALQMGPLAAVPALPVQAGAAAAAVAGSVRDEAEPATPQRKHLPAGAHKSGLTGVARIISPSTCSTSEEDAGSEDGFAPEPATPVASKAADAACAGPSGSAAWEAGPKEGRETAGGLDEGAASSASTTAQVRAAALGIKTLRQKWNLEFVDPVLEGGFEAWFNRQQTVVDLQVFRCVAVLLLLLAGALAVRGGTTSADLLAIAHGLLSAAVLGGVMLLNTQAYVARRSAIVASVRIASAALLLSHSFLDPGFYAGNLLKGLAGSGAITLAVNSFRSRLPFSAHLLVQLVKLYMCSMANAFTHADAERTACVYLPLLAATGVQLLCALAPSLALYRMEAAQRRTFLAAGVEAGILQVPGAPRHRTAPAGSRCCTPASTM